MYWLSSFSYLSVIKVNISGSSVEMEDMSEKSGKKPFDSGGDQGTKTSKHLDFPLKLLQIQPQCEVYPDLHKIIQVGSGLGKWPWG